MPSDRRRLARGIYEDPSGISVVVFQDGRQHETRFDPGTPLDRLIRWRANKVAEARALAPRDARGTLARDIVRYLKRLKGQAGYKSERSHLRSWLKLWPRIRRWQISTEKVELAIARWRNDGLFAKTIRHRCRVLKSVFRRLDGPRVACPVDDAKLPARPKPRPVSVADGLIDRVAASLVAAERRGRLRDAKTRARFLVKATTGRRPAEVKQAKTEDVQLERRLWFTRTAKGGINNVLVLNDEMIRAWTIFIAADAWGDYDDASHAKTLRRHGWPKGIKPYNLRHSAAIALRARGGDLGDVQHLLGHASIQTTNENYLHVLPDRDAKASERLSGRFASGVFADYDLDADVKARHKRRRTGSERDTFPGRVSMFGQGHDAKPRGFTGKTKRAVHASGRSSRRSKSRKTA